MSNYLDYFKKREIKEDLKDKVREISKKRNRWGWNLDTGEELYNYIEENMIPKIISEQEDILEERISELREDYEDKIRELNKNHNNENEKLKKQIYDLKIIIDKEGKEK